MRILAEGADWGGIETHIHQFLTALRPEEHGLDVRLWLFEGGRLGERIGEEGLARVETLPATATEQLRWLRRAVRREKPALLHAHGLKAEVLGAAAIAGTPARLLSTAHSDPGESLWRAPGR